MKECTRCGQRKVLHDFQIRKASKDGLSASCKKCLSLYDRQRAKLPHRVEMREQYAKTEAGRASTAAAKKRFAERNEVQQKARTALGNAVRDGKIKKPEVCEACLEPGMLHGHHHDYSKPLSVVWLCPPCHAKAHVYLRLVEQRENEDAA